MDLGIRGRKAIVCAASKGLGRACAISLARENHLPIIVFNIHEPGAFTAVMKGEGRFTTVHEEQH